MLDQFKKKAAGVQGSGWTWLAFNKDTKRLEITTTANQNRIAERNLSPILGVDVWEHAYYLDYKNARAKYLENIWDVVNWKKVAQRYDTLVDGD